MVAIPSFRQLPCCYWFSFSVPTVFPPRAPTESQMHAHVNFQTHRVVHPLLPSVWFLLLLLPLLFFLGPPCRPPSSDSSLDLASSTALSTRPPSAILFVLHEWALCFPGPKSSCVLFSLSFHRRTSSSKSSAYGKYDVRVLTYLKKSLSYCYV